MSAFSPHLHQFRHDLQSSKSVSWSDGGGGGGGGVGDPPCIKIGYSSRLVPRSEKGPPPMY